MWIPLAQVVSERRRGLSVPPEGSVTKPVVTYNLMEPQKNLERWLGESRHPCCIDEKKGSENPKFTQPVRDKASSN